jgi:hypothetical protein
LHHQIAVRIGRVSLRRIEEGSALSPPATSDPQFRKPMPLIEVTYDTTVSEATLRGLAELLPAVVGEAVACPEEPKTGPPAVGDIEIRFRPKGPLDVGDLNCVIEVRTKRFPSRLQNKEERVELIRKKVQEGGLEVGQLGVWLTFTEGSWAQS